jgi:hypothetical protein
MIGKEQILAEIKRTAQENGGFPLGQNKFFTLTRIRQTDWRGRYWARWGDALLEAGFEPNLWRSAYSEDFILEKLVALIRQLGHFPVKSEIQLLGQTDSDLPSTGVFRRLGSKNTVVSKLLTFCQARPGNEDIVDVCMKMQPKPVRVPSTVVETQVFGHVYLLKSGRFHKIGRSNAVGRRERELAIQLPEKSNVVHSISTDDPPGIEEYWHRRFAGRRKNGEWFELSAEDVSAFRRRKFM